MKLAFDELLDIKSLLKLCIKTGQRKEIIQLRLFIFRLTLSKNNFLPTAKSH